MRGWVERPQDAPPAPTGTAGIEGVFQPSEGTGAFDDDPLDDVFPQLRVADLVQRLDNDLFSGYAVLTETSPGTNTGAAGLVPADITQLPDPGQFTALRNLLYAVEWWFFGGFALFIWWRFVTEEAAQDLAVTGGPEPDPEDEPAVSTLEA